MILPWVYDLLPTENEGGKEGGGILSSVVIR